MTDNCFTQDRETTDGWVEIVYRARLWDAVPADERVDRDEIIRRWVGLSPHYRDRVLDSYDHPQCEIALQNNKYGVGKWMPCSGQVNDDGRRCKRHGGPGKQVERKSYGDLRAENEALRQRLAALEAGAS